jgi:hypothetical protein
MKRPINRIELKVSANHYVNCAFLGIVSKVIKKSMISPWE